MILVYWNALYHHYFSIVPHLHDYIPNLFLIQPSSIYAILYLFTNCQVDIKVAPGSLANEESGVYTDKFLRLISKK